eukprot:TRINITY_DN890_c0_g1_i3.p1 TRINITY_DN890_c0_g1~~TRINITY_DN890_c0_g1_i3.p1  ORF type:complete len:154 (+),score=28.71 TRINITY_DN890_c0_g1_i3:64-525(+)
MCAAQSHEFWKQRVYKEERERHLLNSRYKLPESPSHVLHYPPNVKSMRNSSSPVKSLTQTAGSYGNTRLPPLGSPTRSTKIERVPPNVYQMTSSGGPLFSDLSPTKSMQQSGEDAESFIPYRPRGPPATKHGVAAKYQTFTYQGQSFIENNHA